MATTVTSLKIPDELKQRVASVVDGTEQSLHAFMVEAIEKQTGLMEKRLAFIAEADAANSELLKSGKGYDGVSVHAYLRARAKGKTATKPKAKTWRS
ncbi:MAG: hypothetical protein WCD07_07940 [Burkholderiales bacterium]